MLNMAYTFTRNLDRFYYYYYCTVYEIHIITQYTIKEKSISSFGLCVDP